MLASRLIVDVYYVLVNSDEKVRFDKVLSTGRVLIWRKDRHNGKEYPQVVGAHQLEIPENREPTIRPIRTLSRTCWDCGLKYPTAEIKNGKCVGCREDSKKCRTMPTRKAA
jgi:hypothetical protein